MAAMAPRCALRQLAVRYRTVAGHQLRLPAQASQCGVCRTASLGRLTGDTGGAIVGTPFAMTRICDLPDIVGLVIGVTIGGRQRTQPIGLWLE